MGEGELTGLKQRGNKGPVPDFDKVEATNLLHGHSCGFLRCFLPIRIPERVAPRSFL